MARVRFPSKRDLKRLAKDDPCKDYKRGIALCGPSWFEIEDRILRLDETTSEFYLLYPGIPRIVTPIPATINYLLSMAFSLGRQSRAT